MKVLVVGSEGFIGEALVARLLAGDAVGPARQPATEVTLLDRRIAPRAADARVRTIEGDICDRAVLNAAIAGGVDAVFHLASIPGGAAEQNYELGLKVNLYATLDLLETLRLSGQKPRVVFASTIGIYGVPLPDVIDELTIPEPTLSYGAQKLIGEILVSDYGRRGFISGVSVRIPGIVARPPTPGMLSIFLSDIIRELAAGRSFTCPVAADGPSWWMSRPCMVQNLLHASSLADAVLVKQSSFLMPVLRLTLGEVVAGIASLHGAAVLERVRYEPNAKLQAQFASLPPLRCPKSEAVGFRNDGDVRTLVLRALAGI